MSEKLLPVAFYGTLLEGLPATPGRPRFEAHGRYLGPCLIPGSLYDHGPYPWLLAGGGEVKGQLWQPHDAQALAMLDEWEGADDGDPYGRYVARRELELIAPAVRAWAYVYECSTDGMARISSGDWRSLAKAHDLPELLRLRRECQARGDG